MTIATVASRREAQRRVDTSTLAISILAAGLAWRGWSALRDAGPIHTITAGQVQLAGPIVIGFVLVVFTVERLMPAEHRAWFARGHQLDLTYFLLHAVLVVPLIILIGSGFSTALADAAPWLVLPHTDVVPRWAFVVAAVVAIDAVDWLVHLANHKITALWQLHAVHHSQEELSILSTFRTHPLVHVSFVVSAIPVLALAENAAAPAAVLTVYACLGSLPHANLRWSYGWLGRYAVSPTYHRRHHSPDKRLDVNLGTVLTVWDRMSGRAVYPVLGAAAPTTGLAGRPIPIEQAAMADPLLTILVSQWSQPFLSTRGVPR